MIKASKEVIDKLKEGYNLCPKCFGGCYIEEHYCGDWIGDKEYDYIIECKECKGKGYIE